MHRLAIARRVAFFLGVALGGVGCEKPTHENIDRWGEPEKGPGKLVKALADRGLAPDLRAHAAEVLVQLGETTDVRARLAEAPKAERAALLAALIPRLWEDARVGDPLARPTKRQVAAKDALFQLRDLAEPTERERIDGSLADWMGAMYEERAKLGNVGGSRVVRAIGAKAAGKLLAQGRELVASAQGASKYAPLGPELLSAIALTGTPDGVAFLLDLIEGTAKHPDPELPIAAMGALQRAYHPSEEVSVDRSALVPHVARLLRLAQRPESPGEVVNASAELIAATGREHCVAPLAALAKNKEEARRWMGAQLALECAGAAAIAPLARALPTDLAVDPRIVDKYFWRHVIALGNDAVEPARSLLADESWVARLTGVRVLEAVGQAEDVERLRALGGDETRLRGYGEGLRPPSEPAARRPKDPVLGAVALEAAAVLEKARRVGVK